ncbi:2698_t:CDS:2, partial [Gigaspora rosea]
MNNNNTLCSLCNKTLKNLRGLHIHQKAVHQTNTKSELFLCPHCSHAYKTKGGLCHHETFKHYNYNIPGDFFKLPQNHINKKKASLVYLIRSRLMLHSNHLGPQSVSSPMTESEFSKKVFEHSQWSEVVLVSNSPRSMKNIKPLRSSFQINPEIPEMIIIWEKKKINDEEGNISLTGWITLKFL